MEPVVISTGEEPTFDHENICTICRDSLSSGSEIYTNPTCNHKFHCMCIVEWFRLNSSCPYCRSQDDDTVSSFTSGRIKVKYLKRYSRRKNAPADLKRIVKSISKEQKALREVNRSKLEWKRSERGQEYKQIRKEYLKVCKWSRSSRYYKKIRNLEQQLELYPIIPLVIQMNPTAERSRNT